jgi:hypothetical protein
MVSFRIDEDDFSRLESFAQQTSCSRAEVHGRVERRGQPSHPTYSEVNVGGVVGKNRRTGIHDAHRPQ